MQQQRNLADQILEIVKAHPGCGLDELTEHLAAVQWSDVFVEVDRLSRSGRLRLIKKDSSFLFKIHAV
ncbi:MAG TPA: hypothetical protein VFS39_17935 [Nitrospira sp.]|nr:hypothetical protein [Nitrospira sp.]